MSGFAKNFLWGAATSAYQVEGNNSFSDWWKWEQEGRIFFASGAACRHYDLFEKDFDLAKSLNHNCHRLSIEWSRVEPQEGRFSIPEFEHYKRVIRALRARSLEPVVTLHHFTNPQWFSEKGGWLSKEACADFLRYVSKVLEYLGKDVTFWVTINEPMVYAYFSYCLAAWPPKQSSTALAKKVLKNMCSAHIQAYRLIRAYYLNSGLNLPKISFAANMQYFQAHNNSLKNRLGVYLRDKAFNLSFLKKAMRSKALDFIGLNYYTRQMVQVRGWRLSNFLFDECVNPGESLKKNSLGWDIYPEGLYKLLMRLKSYNLPVFILENGVCTDDDNLRRTFIRSHLQSVKRALDEGVNIIGYIYWSLLDNFEWDKGFEPRFGLVEVDYGNFERRVRESAKEFAMICANNGL